MSACHLVSMSLIHHSAEKVLVSSPAALPVCPGYGHASDFSFSDAKKILHAFCVRMAFAMLDFVESLAYPCACGALVRHVSVHFGPDPKKIRQQW